MDNRLIGKSYGKYQIVEPLGEGGMASVYKAFDPTLERYVAIKIIRAGSQMDPDFLVRFQREARALAKLDHPYILKVLDYGEENGVPYLVMPFVGQGTLKKYTKTRLPYEQAIRMILPVAEALSYAHKRKIIHRDIKPANILFGESGEPILSDFGIAKMLDAGDQTQLTNAGIGVGTPAYMAPEQWNGIADDSTDIYALGIVLYELITGRCPFQADTPAAILLKQVQDPLPRPITFVADLPDHIEALLFKALAKDPALRFQKMQEFIDGMNAVLQGNVSAYVTQFHAAPDQQMTQISSRTIVSQPAISSAAPVAAPKRKLTPLMIGGGVLLAMACVAVILVVIFSQLNPFGRNDPTAVAGNNPQSGAVSQNSQGTPLSAPNQNPETQNEQSGAGTAEGVTATQAAQSLQSTANASQQRATAAGAASQPTQPAQPTSDPFAGHPSDVPIYTPNNSDVSITEAEGMRMYLYSSNAESTTISGFFVDEMIKRGWTLVTTSSQPALNTVMYAYEKGTRTAVINVMGVQPGQTQIQVMVAEEE